MKSGKNASLFRKKDGEDDVAKHLDLKGDAEKRNAA